MSFHVSQRVVCIDDSDTACVVKGRIYTVVGVRLPYLDLDRLEDGKNDGGMYARRFRPVKETNIDIFTAMCAPKPKQKVFIIGTGVLQIKRDGKWIDIDQVEGFQ